MMGETDGRERSRTILLITAAIPTGMALAVLVLLGTLVVPVSDKALWLALPLLAVASVSVRAAVGRPATQGARRVLSAFAVAFFLTLVVVAGLFVWVSNDLAKGFA